MPSEERRSDEETGEDEAGMPPGLTPEDAPVDPSTEEPAPPRRGLDILSLDDIEDDDWPGELDEEEFEDDEIRTVLITGACGNIAGKLRTAWAEAYDLILIDQVADPDDPDLILADLSVMDEGWITHFHGVDTVIHLAANPDEFASWDDVVGPNLDALANVLHASALAGVERIIFASSNHAMGGYRPIVGMPITVDLPPKPDGPYGATKLFGERLGRSIAAAFDITFIALRIGWVQPGENRAASLPDDWARGMWLSNGDLIRLFECAVEVELDENQFVVAHGVSNNRGTRWDLGVGADLLGYCPIDDAFADES